MTDRIQDLFASHRLRCTKQRVEVYAALASCDAHPTAEELYEMVNCPCGGGECCASRATVYNALEALVNAGLARRLATGSGPCRFDADLSEHCHVVTEDGRFIDVPAEASEALVSSISTEAVAALAERLGVDISRVSITLHADGGGRDVAGSPTSEAAL